MKIIIITIAAALTLYATELLACDKREGAIEFYKCRAEEAVKPGGDTLTKTLNAPDPAIMEIIHKYDACEAARNNAEKMANIYNKKAAEFATQLKNGTPSTQSNRLKFGMEDVEVYREIGGNYTVIITLHNGQKTETSINPVLAIAREENCNIAKTCPVQ